MINLLKFWHLDIVAIIFMALLGGLYFFPLRGKIRKKSRYFFGALLLILLCTCSPLSWLGSHYLFSAHMVAHITLFLVVPPLLILSIPSRVSPVAKSVIRRISKIGATVPWLPWILGIGIMWFWHIPAIFNSSMSMDGSGWGSFLHHAQSLSLMLVGILFWWPVLGTLPSYRMSELKGILYLFSACIGCSLLGLLITFAPAGEFTYYANLPAGSGWISLIRKDWGISAFMDQQIAGLIMWVPGCLIYLAVSLYLMRKWFFKNEKASEVSGTTTILNIKKIKPWLYEEEKRQAN